MKERKKNRLDKFHYDSGYFFVTINVKEHKKVFGDVIRDNMILNKYGKEVETKWLWLGHQYSYISLLDFVIMPNHIHGIIYIEDVGDVRERPLHTKHKKNLGSIIAAFKTVSAKKLKELGLKNFQRQRSFYDHIIRNEKDMERIIEYIQGNPYKRKNDEYYC